MTASSAAPLLELAVALPGDAPDLLALQLRVDGQTSHLLLGAGERDPDPGVLEARLAARRPDRGSFTVLARDRPGGTPVGWCTVDVLPLARASLTGSITLAVDAAHHRRGVGRALLAGTTDEARRRGLRRLELSVMVHNTAARMLYSAAGFVVEGTRRQCLLVDGVLVDELMMARLLECAGDGRRPPTTLPG